MCVIKNSPRIWFEIIHNDALSLLWKMKAHSRSHLSNRVAVMCLGHICHLGSPFHHRSGFPLPSPVLALLFIRSIWASFSVTSHWVWPRGRPVFWGYTGFFPGQNTGEKKSAVAPQLILRNGYGEVVQDFIFQGHFLKLLSFFILLDYALDLC